MTNAVIEDVLSPVRLGITQLEHDALIWTREQIAKGMIVFDQYQAVEHLRGFNMNTPRDDSECGSTCCIGGWMFVYMEERNLQGTHRNASQYVRYSKSHALHPLFYPGQDGGGGYLVDADGVEMDFPLEMIPAEWGLKAIDNFLGTGDADWPEVVGQA